MSNEVLNSRSPSSIKFDDLAALEITDPVLLSTVAAALNKKNYGNSPCIADDACIADSWCILDNIC
ncbi:MAG: hypothetical protein HKM01_07860 [Gallionella sp.]|nr:hypothetical protein [Gallionella sp.]